MSASAFGQVRQGKPPDDASLDEKVAYLMRYLDILGNETTEVLRQAQEAVNRTEGRLTDRLDGLSSRLNEINEGMSSIRSALFGHDGRGLRRAAIGLVMTAVEVVLTAFGLSW